MLGKWPSPAKLPETRALKVSALDQVIEVRTLEGMDVLEYEAMRSDSERRVDVQEVSNSVSRALLEA